VLGGTAKDFGDAGVVAARAFHHDPFFEFLAPRPIQRARGLALFCGRTFRFSATPAMSSAHVRATGGSSAWPPGSSPVASPPVAAQLGSPLRRSGRSPSAAGARRRDEVPAGVEKAHPHERHWYLQLLVVDPSWQREESVRSCSIRGWRVPTRMRSVLPGRRRTLTTSPITVASDTRSSSS